ncbi:MAG: GIY-YIG nuclease family protein [Epsilonproteobacteria bacterium]|nr:MAG: GIY-YIG nuclease family protein [Campylobacterota bacterium]
MAKKENRNMVLIESVRELDNEVLFDKFKLKKHFEFLCELKPNFKDEKLDIINEDKDIIKNSGLVYIFVINGRIFKIGHTITSMIKRIQSYNCGKIKYRESGTCSTTNYFILQSILEIGEIVDVYAFFPEQPKYKIFGKIYQNGRSPSKTAENIIINEFIKNHEKKSIGCTQT